MAARRLIYLAALLFCGIFYIAYGQWLSWLILITVIALPWFSLLLTLPAICQFRAAPNVPAILEMGEHSELWIMGSAPWPMPPFRGRLKLKRLLTGETRYYQDPEDLHTEHCGGIAVTPEALQISDYLGLFAFPVRCRETARIVIRPKPAAMTLQTGPEQFIARRWKPKFGGGYGENHELRLYRPGDSLNQVHWKLSAKTGDLIIREPMEPDSGQILLTLELQGAAGELDRKLGRLLWLGRHLLQQMLCYEIQALTDDGLLSFCVATEGDLNQALDTLLCSKAMDRSSGNRWDTSAAWHCHIGGEPDEA